MSTKMLHLRFAMLLLFSAACLAVLFASADAKPTKEILFGSPYLFHEFDYPVDPQRSSRLAPAFQAANGRQGSRLIAYFGTGGLRSYEVPAPSTHRRYV